MNYIRLLKILLVAILLFCTTTSYAQKLTPEEIISKHLDSIGTREKREQVKNLLVLFDLELKMLGNPRGFNGKGVIFSTNEKNIWGMSFNSPDYPSDKFGFDGKSTKVGFVRPASRSLLGEFLLIYNKLLEESLLGGTLSNSWTLLNVAKSQPKLVYEGSKKIEGKEAYAISYTPKGGSDLDIKMYFDKQTFQHIRTEYNRIISSKLVAGGVDSSGINASAGQGVERYRIIEDFSNFKNMGGLNLPSEYKIYYNYTGPASTARSQNRNRDVEWVFKVINYSQNQPTDDKSFDIESN